MYVLARISYVSFPAHIYTQCITTANSHNLAKNLLSSETETAPVKRIGFVGYEAKNKTLKMKTFFL